MGWIIGAAVLLVIWQFRPKQGNQAQERMV